MYPFQEGGGSSPDIPMKKSKIASKLFESQFNCSQALLGAFGVDLGMDRDLCLKISTIFGAGITRRQHVCGAVSGALMVLGLKFGQGQEDDYAVKQRAYEIGERFLKEFEERHGSILCRDLLNFDISTEEARKTDEAIKLFTTVCPGLVKSAAEIVDAMI